MRLEKEDRGEPTLFEKIVCFIKYKILRLRPPIIEFRMGYGLIDWRSLELITEKKG